MNRRRKGNGRRQSVNRIHAANQKDYDIQRRRMRNKRRRERKKRIYITLASVFFVILLLIFAIRLGKRKDNKQTSTSNEIEVEVVDPSLLLHLSFSSLIADEEAAFSQEDQMAAMEMDQGRVTTEEFQAILQQLYDKNYILIRISDIAAVSEDGEKFVQKELLLPKGKKPLLISWQNASYDLEYQGQGVAEKLVISPEGDITCEMTDESGEKKTGSYDLVPCLNDFIKLHPDFSWKSARGILGLTGYNGILGYRTAKGMDIVEGNRYAAKYGTFDLEKEKEEARKVVAALEKQGWEFACNGYGKVSYASDLESVKADLSKWKKEVEPLLGEAAQILMYPFGTDLKVGGQYTEKDKIRNYLGEEGFHYYCGMNMSQSLIQITDDYFRCSYRNLDGYRMYKEVYGDSVYFKGILELGSLYDQNRPGIIKVEEEN